MQPKRVKSVTIQSVIKSTEFLISYKIVRKHTKSQIFQLPEQVLTFLKSYKMSLSFADTAKVPVAEAVLPRVHYIGLQPFKLQ